MCLSLPYLEQDPESLLTKFAEGLKVAYKMQKHFNNWPKANRMQVNLFKLQFGVEISFRATDVKDLADWMESWHKKISGGSR